MTWTPQWGLSGLKQGTLIGRRTYAMQVRTIWDSDAHANQVAAEACYISGPFSMPRLATMMTTNPALIFAPYLKMIANPAGTNDPSGTLFPNKWYEHFKDGTKCQQQGSFVNWLMETGFNAASQQAATVQGITASSWGEFSVKQACAQVASNNALSANAGKHPWRSLWFDTAGSFCADQTPGFWQNLAGTNTNPGWDPQDLSQYGTTANKLKWLQMVDYKGDLARNLVPAFPAINGERLFIAANGMRGGAGGGGTGLELPAHVDMAMTEGWLYKFGLPQFSNATTYESSMQLFLDCQLTLGTVAQPLDWGANSGSAGTAKQQGRFVAASNLIVARGLLTFDWGTTKATRPDLETAADPNLYAMDLGTPRAGHSPASVAGTMGSTGHRIAVGASNGQASATGLYGREYDGGIAIANITGGAINFKADFTYTSIDGGGAVTAGSLISVPALSGVFYTTTGGTGGTVPTNTTLPYVLGDPREGQQQFDQYGVYTGSPVPALTQQWQQSPNGTTGWTNITGATASSWPIPIITGGTPKTYAADDFSDTEVDTWAAADTGGTWTLEQGATADFDKTSGVGTVSHSTANSTKFQSLNIAQTDAEALITCIFAAVSTGGNQHASLILRFQDVNNYYRLNAICFSSNSHVTVQCEKVVAGIATNLGMTKDLGVYSAGAGVKMKLDTQGSTIKGKAWLASGGEPGSFDLTVTDTAISAAGKVAVRTQRGSGNTNSATPQFKFDDLTVTSIPTGGGGGTSFVGQFLRVQETATNTAGNVTVNSASTAVVVAGSNTDPIWLTEPTVTGTPAEGLILTAAPGTMTGTPTPTVTYQWEQSATGAAGSWSSVSGETNQTYGIATGQAGKYIRVQVIATNTGATTHSWSLHTAVVTSGDVTPAFSAAPTIAGTTQVGSTLTMTTGTATGSPTPTLSQQWESAPDNATWSSISAALGTTYILQPTDVGQYVRVTQTATNRVGATASSATSVGPVTSAAGTGVTLGVVIE
jgi:hypothetical protein